SFGLADEGGAHGREQRATQPHVLLRGLRDGVAAASLAGDPANRLGRREHRVVAHGNARTRIDRAGRGSTRHSLEGCHQGAAGGRNQAEGREKTMPQAKAARHRRPVAESPRGAAGAKRTSARARTTRTSAAISFRPSGSPRSNALDSKPTIGTASEATA